MIHELGNISFDNQYKDLQPASDSRIMFIQKGQVLVKEQAGRISYFTYAEVEKYAGDCVYLFEVGGQLYFLPREDVSLPPEILSQGEYRDWVALRDAHPKQEAFAAMTAMHLYTWYSSVRYCGRCGTKAIHAKHERMMQCPACHNMMFPKISPAVIVAVTDGERLLVTKYAGGKNRAYALVAGFVEIGETAEECVRREVMEEVGIHIKDIRYYDNQPWGFAGNLMLGYTARLDGDHTIDLDRQELSEAAWLKPEEITEIPDFSSLTREMIRRFRKGKLFEWQKEV